MKKELVDFMKWYKNSVPIGTQKSSVNIVEDYLESINSDALLESQIISENEVKVKKCVSANGCHFPRKRSENNCIGCDYFK